MSLTKESAIDIIWHVINKSLMWRNSWCSKHVYLRYMQLESDRTRPKNSLPFCTLAWTPGNVLVTTMLLNPEKHKYQTE